MQALIFISSHPGMISKTILDIWNAYNRKVWDVLASLSFSLQESAEKIGQKKVRNISKKIHQFSIEQKDFSRVLVENLEMELTKVLDILRKL